MSPMMLATDALFDRVPYEREFSAHVIGLGELGVALDRTLFYPTGGGQPCDLGHFHLPDGGLLDVLGVQRDPQDRSIIWHQIGDNMAELTIGVQLLGCLDWERRYQHMRMHTCLHVLCSLIDAPVTGCSIAVDKGRLDFDLPESVLDREALTHQLNELVGRELAVASSSVAEGDLPAILSMSRTSIPPPAFDGRVRLIEIAGLDIQPCGGTHVSNTREIGLVVCERIEKKSRHNRRVSLRFA
ncbi:MAG: alanyl-tRNA editing protein [Pseudomonas sp.]